MLVNRWVLKSAGTTTLKWARKKKKLVNSYRPIVWMLCKAESIVNIEVIMKCIKATAKRLFGGVLDTQSISQRVEGKVTSGQQLRLERYEDAMQCIQFFVGSGDRSTNIFGGFKAIGCKRYGEWVGGWAPCRWVWMQVRVLSCLCPCAGLSLAGPIWQGR